MITSCNKIDIEKLGVKLCLLLNCCHPSLTYINFLIFCILQEDRLEAALTVEKSMDLEECQIIEQRFEGFQQVCRMTSDL